MSYNKNASVIFGTSGTYKWICPSNITSVTLTLIGGGGGGGGGGSGSAGSWSSFGGTLPGGSGGGAGYAGSSGNHLKLENVTVVPGTTYTLVVGAPGIGGTGGAATARITNPQDGYAGNYATQGGNTYFYTNYASNSSNPSGYIAYGGIGGSPGSGGTGVAGGGGAGGAGSQAGVTGGTSQGQNYLISQVETFGFSHQIGIYAIYTSGATPPALTTISQATGPSGVFVNLVTGNVCQNTGNEPIGSITTPPPAWGLNTASPSTNLTGGIGGIYAQTNQIPIYFVGEDFSGTGSPTAPLPQFNTTSGTGMGNGGVSGFNSGDGYSPSSSAISFWRTGLVTPNAYGAGGLGGPGGGGGAGGGVAGGGQGGAGYQGDNGLGGVVVISY